MSELMTFQQRRLREPAVALLARIQSLRWIRRRSLPGCRLATRGTSCKRHL